MSLEQRERVPAHVRQLSCRAWRRKDGMWDIECELSDTKGEAVPFRGRPAVEAGEFMHRMSLALVIDGDYTIRDARAKVFDSPWPECSETDERYRALIGLTIGPGFKRRVQELLGGSRACTHVNHMIGEIANVYMQATWPDRVAAQRAVSADPREWPDARVTGFVDQCHAWRRDGEALRREYPELVERGTKTD